MTKRRWRIGLVSVSAILMVPAGFGVAILAGIPRNWRFTFALALGGVVSFALSGAARHLIHWVNSSAGVGLFFTHSNAEKTVTLSHVESMIAFGNARAASRELDLLLARHGLDERLCQLAVDFHLGKLGERERAEVLLRRMRAEQPERFEKYATQRLIDLYIANIATHEKALPELRRLIARYPGTPDALGAAVCADRLRAASQAATPINATPNAAVV